MNANVVGLIELENGLCANLHEFHLHDSEYPASDLEQSLARLDGMAADEKPSTSSNSSEWGNYHTFQTRFVRANLERLNDELNIEFQRLLVQLFETNE